jgi:hypothetical protein
VADCGRGSDGKFSEGNDCASGHDRQPRVKEPPPKEIVTKLRDKEGGQTDVARKMYSMGLTERGLAKLIEGLGGSPKQSNVKSNLNRLNIHVADKDGNRMFMIEFRRSGVRVYPTKAKGAVSGSEAKAVEQLAKSVFPKQSHKVGQPFGVKVFTSPDSLNDWKKEMDAKYKEIEDKYKTSVYLPPHRRPKSVRSLNASYASLLAFLESRNCGTGMGGFQAGNTCASGKLADAASGAAAGAVKGAAVAFGVTGMPTIAAKGAVAGATVGAVKGLYDNSMQPTRVMRMIEKLGSSEKQVSSLVKRLGGSPKSVATVKGGKLVIAVKNKAGDKVFDVQMDNKRVTVTPSRKSGALSSSEVSQVKAIAKEHSPREVSVVVKSKSPSYAATLVRKGFSLSASAAGDLIATVVIPIAPSIIATGAIVAKEKIFKK